MQVKLFFHLFQVLEATPPAPTVKPRPNPTNSGGKSAHPVRNSRPQPLSPELKQIKILEKQVSQLQQ